MWFVALLEPILEVGNVNIIYILIIMFEKYYLS